VSRRRSEARRSRRAKAAHWADAALEPFSEPALAEWWSATGRSELAELLHWRWDPLGIACAFPDAADEYVGYEVPIAELLHGGADAAELARHLHDVHARRMGMAEPDAAPSAETIRAAEEIAAWYEASLRRWRALGTPARPV
jgi:hypothetical protein